MCVYVYDYVYVCINISVIIIIIMPGSLPAIMYLRFMMYYYVYVYYWYCHHDAGYRPSISIIVIINMIISCIISSSINCNMIVLIQLCSSYVLFMMYVYA